MSQTINPMNDRLLSFIEEVLTNSHQSGRVIIMKFQSGNQITHGIKKIPISISSYRNKRTTRVSPYPSSVSPHDFLL